MWSSGRTRSCRENRTRTWALAGRRHFRISTKISTALTHEAPSGFRHAEAMRIQRTLIFARCFARQTHQSIGTVLEVPADLEGAGLLFRLDLPAEGNRTHRGDSADPRNFSERSCRDGETPGHFRSANRTSRIHASRVSRHGSPIRFRRQLAARCCNLARKKRTHSVRIASGYKRTIKIALHKIA